MFLSESDVIFCLDERVIQSRVSNSGPLVVLRPFTENKILCVVLTLDIYLRKTELLWALTAGYSLACTNRMLQLEWTQSVDD